MTGPLITSHIHDSAGSHITWLHFGHWQSVAIYDWLQSALWLHDLHLQSSLLASPESQWRCQAGKVANRCQHTELLFFPFGAFLSFLSLLEGRELNSTVLKDRYTVGNWLHEEQLSGAFVVDLKSFPCSERNFQRASLFTSSSLCHSHQLCFLQSSSVHYLFSGSLQIYISFYFILYN